VLDHWLRRPGESSLHEPSARYSSLVQDLDGGARCLGGEVNSSICSAMGCEGVVTDGLVRDLPEVEAVGFRYLARGVGVAR
jgi:regulator of RNase E activity RraA